MIQIGNIRDAHAFQLQLQSFDAELCNTLIFPLGVCEKVKGFYHI